MRLIENSSVTKELIVAPIRGAISTAIVSTYIAKNTVSTGSMSIEPNLPTRKCAYINKSTY